MGRLSGPRMGAPVEPLTGAGVPESRPQRGGFGSVLANGTVAVASAADEVDEAGGEAGDATDDTALTLD